jgi:hypothetical protein
VGSGRSGLFGSPFSCVTSVALRCVHRARVKGLLMSGKSRNKSTSTSPRPLPPVLQAALTRACQARPGCLLCGAPCKVVGLFIPTTPAAWGFPQGMQAGCVYALCADCQPGRSQQHNREIADRVEKVLWGERRRQEVSRWN